MIKFRIIDTPTFDVIGKKTWISRQDNNLFGQFWIHCREEKLFETLDTISGYLTGKITNSSVLGISCVEKDPSQRSFYYLIAIEKPGYYNKNAHLTVELEAYTIPACKWAVFECVGKVPESIMRAEMFAFLEWLPTSGFVHAKAPEMEVYFPGNDGLSGDNYCEFWLPITR